MQTNNQNIPALKLVGIRKTYGNGDTAVEALRGVDLNFRKNEFVSILGPSGCGKTTLLNIVGGLDRYTKGDLIIDGKSTKNFNDRDWDAYRNNSIGFVFQSYNLIPHQNVLSNVELALELSGASKKERKAKALSILEKVGLKGLEHKRPNQLSGGQMQRVAIARALINDPDIILADEPTGALDSETSVQVMDLLKEIASDRLVIMVTHNPELANKYSTRIIKLVDGVVVEDSNEFNPTENPIPKKNRKPKMGVKTAFLLSLKNLFSKKTRTIITSIAGSIGIVGVALILALSNGFNAYMARMQTDTLSNYPLTISESAVDLSEFSEMKFNELVETYPELDNVYVHEAMKNLVSMLKSNHLSDRTEEGFLTYLEKVDPSLYYAISYGYGFSVNSYLWSDIWVSSNGVMPEKPSFSSIDSVVGMISGSFDSNLDNAMGGMVTTSAVASSVPTTQEIPDEQLMKEQYDLLYGDFPSFEEDGYNQMVLVVDQYNGVSDITMLLLGYISGTYNAQKNEFEFEDVDKIALDKIVGENSHKLYLANNQKTYTYNDALSAYMPNFLMDRTQLEEIEIVGIIRAKKNVEGLLETGLAYTPALTDKILNDNMQSDICNFARQNNGEVNVLVNPMDNTTLKMGLRSLAGVDTPNLINVYAKDFDSKQLIKKHIDDWNARFDEDDERIITYSDIMSDMFGALETMVNAVSYVLIAFTSISLVVSSVMIGIITYTSVMERTKEIGVLRSLGASKGEIKNVFNAETFIIGLCSGLIGVGSTYLLSIPINIILGKFIPDIGNLANLDPLAGLVLICISVALTLIAGLIPASIAAKKDPVNALRSE